MKEYGLTDTNFPGIFNIQLENYKCIHTPYPLWQLLVFHKAIKLNNSKKQLIYSKYLFQDIKGQLRYDVKDSKPVATLIHRYLVLLEKCGVLNKQTVYRKYIHPFKIENNVLPIVANKEFNSNVALYFSEFNSLSLNPKDYYSTEVFFTDTEQELLEQDTKYYQNLVLHKMETPLQIDQELFNWFYKAKTDHAIELELYEKEFIEYLGESIVRDKFISKEVHDTFIALIKEKFNN